MKRQVIIDTGPLVAFLNNRDRFHVWVKARFAELAPPLLTCEAVIAEACYLLRGKPGGAPAVIELLSRGVIETPFRLAPHAGALARLMERYASVPISLADASLVLLSELLPESAVFTLDGDFRIYRRHGKSRIALIIPEQPSGRQ